MLGAIVGDIVGSVYEFRNHRSKEFELFKQQCFATDDSIMTLAIAKAVLESAPDHHDLADMQSSICARSGSPIHTVAMAAVSWTGCIQTNRNPTIALAMVRPCASARSLMLQRA